MKQNSAVSADGLVQKLHLTLRGFSKELVFYLYTEILLCPLDMSSAGSADGRMHKCMQSVADAAHNLCLHVELCKKMPW